jgi:hypothetical protein
LILVGNALAFAAIGLDSSSHRNAMTNIAIELPVATAFAKLSMALRNVFF